MSSQDRNVYITARAASAKGVSSSLSLMIKRSKIMYVNETNRKINKKPVEHNNSFTENTTVSKQGRQYLTQEEILNLIENPTDYGNI